MKCAVLFVLGVVAISTSAFAQTADEAIADRTARQAALDAAEKDGTRVKPEFGSVWLTMNAPDREHARIHTTIAVPGATAQSLGLPDNNRQGGVWIMNAGTSTAHLMT